MVSAGGADRTFSGMGLESVVDRVGRAAAKRLAWGIDTLTGDEAWRLGLVDVLVDGEPLAAARKIATMLATLPHPQSAFVGVLFKEQRLAR